MFEWPSFSYVVAENRYLFVSSVFVMVHVLFDLLLWADTYSSLASKSPIILDRFGSLGLKSA